MAPSLQRLGRILRLLLPVALLVWLWQATDGPEVLSLLRAADPLLLALALGAILAQNTLSALRWRLTAAGLGQPIARGRALREYFLSQFLNMTLPAGVLGDAGRAVRAREGVGLVKAGQAVVIDRMVGQVTLFAVLLAGLSVVGLTGGAGRWPDWVPPLALGIAGGIVGIALLLILLAWLGGRVGRAVGGFLGGVRAAVLSRRAWPRQAGFSLAIVACNLGAFALCAAATGTMLPPLAIVTILPLILATMVIPISVAGWGVREGAAAALWPVLGASAEAGIAASVAMGLVILVASLPGVVVLMAPAPRRRADDPAEGET
ncbi:lysylphosphatidylglycerol synthase transmembrane domain-containing protein [Pseudoroseicyclus tamaricis]|uniref:Flippase-like domain-containing protein n=1 Tax=Pseudoroseicyclus tamaricis TaxID=2705421 RepID=A0A6B2K3M6_9RHOB|nr:lysylphosphatidylglycerol synthase transmembrane domain-containing protein [Pseudoroseicyclus tamaricis]NDV01196.1 flippase-like domain-containing protein [Pseudoroseicyclus tamaricis]